ncbi:MAG: Sulfurtransferase TusA [Pseudomonadota bacterium]|jgi:TusA-related sulfurtransferase
MPFSSHPTPDLIINACGLACPMPLLKAKQGLHQLKTGQYLLVWATDRGSVRDFHAYATLSEHELVAFYQGEDQFGYLLCKGLRAPPEIQFS